MSWRDRPYADEDGQPELRLALPRPTTAVVWLLVANGTAFVADVISQHADPFFWHRVFGLSWNGLFGGHVWQPLTYMFTHGSVLHLLCNMLGLYIFGMEFERAFGRDRFLTFYALCGLVGGIAYLAAQAFEWVPRSVPLVGASGAIYGLLIAAIIFFPHIRVVLIIFPMPIRVFGLIVAGILFIRLISPGTVENLGGEICHVAGAAAGVGALYAWRMMPRIRLGAGRRAMQTGAWQRKLELEQEEQDEVDRILAKVSESGLQSLTRRERRVLAEATQRQQERDRRTGRIDRI